LQTLFAVRTLSINTQPEVAPMKKHLFLQGNIAIGKSTLLREALLPHLEEVGGFYVQRIYKDDQHIGFQLKPLCKATDYQLNRQVAGLQKKNYFIYHDEKKGMQIQLSIFENEGVRFLEKARGKKKKIILMDEIGGVDLYCPAFVQSVMQILNGPQSAIGVLKLARNRKRLDGNFANPTEKEKEVMKNISCIKEHPLVKILELGPGNYQEVQTQVQIFLKNILQV
jgi:nucleoside-triphosphatase THEP1